MPHRYVISVCFLKYITLWLKFDQSIEVHCFSVLGSGVNKLSNVLSTEIVDTFDDRAPAHGVLTESMATHVVKWRITSSQKAVGWSV